MSLQWRSLVAEQIPRARELKGFLELEILSGAPAGVAEQIPRARELKVWFEAYAEVGREGCRANPKG